MFTFVGTSPLAPPHRSAPARDQGRAIYLHIRDAFGHQTQQGVVYNKESPHTVIWYCNHVVVWGLVTNQERFISFSTNSVTNEYDRTVIYD